MEELIIISTIYLWFILTGMYFLRTVRKLKGLNNFILLYIKYSFILSILLSPISIIQIDVSKYLIIIWFTVNMFIQNTLQKLKLNKFDLLSTFVFLFVGVLENISKINLFFPISFVYLITYTVFYTLSSKQTKESKKIVTVISIFSSLSAAIINVLIIFNFSYNYTIIVFLTIILSQLTNQLLLVSEYSKEIDLINNSIGIILSDKENKIKEFVNKIEEIYSKINNCYNAIEVEKSKIEKNKIQDFVREIMSSTTEISPIVSFIEKIIQEYQKKVEDTIKKLPDLSINLENNFEKLLSSREILSEMNTNVMSLVKVALDSEKSVMNVSKSIKELRNISKNLTNSLEMFNEISKQSSILSINISVEASKLGNKGVTLLKLSQQAKKFSDTISLNVESIKKLIKDIDSKAEFSEYITKTLVMSFIEIETNLKSTARNLSSFIEKIEVLSNLAENIKKESQEINKMILIIPEFSTEITRRLEDIVISYKKLKKFSDDTLSAVNYLENSLKIIIENINSIISFIENMKK